MVLHLLRLLHLLEPLFETLAFRQGRGHLGADGVECLPCPCPRPRPPRPAALGNPVGRDDRPGRRHSEGRQNGTAYVPAGQKWMPFSRKEQMMNPASAPKYGWNRWLFFIPGSPVRKMAKWMTSWI